MKIIQITDLHLSSKQNCINITDLNFPSLYAVIKKNVRDFKITLEQTSYDTLMLSLLDEKIKELNPDYVFLTGDIATSSCMIKSAKNFFLSLDATNPLESISPFGNSKPMLGFLDKQWTMVGNHDILPLDSKLKQAIFKSEFDRKSFFDYFEIPYGRLQVKEHGGFVFIFYDFTWSKKRFNHYSNTLIKKYIKHYLGAGIVTKKDLTMIKDVLEEHKNKKIIFLSHYPVYNTKRMNKNLKLINAKDLRKLLSKYEIKFIIAGHTHKFDCKKGKQFVCGTTLACNVEREYNFIEYEFVEDSINVKSYKYKLSAKSTAKEKIEQLYL